MSNEPMQQKIEALEANPDRGLRDTVDLAQARMRHTLGEYAGKHPLISAGMGALSGAALGATAGPGIVEKMQRVPGLVRDIGGNVKDLVGQGAA
jgi:hypothetical protein